MLWLAGLMALLAACAFSFLWYLAFRRPRFVEDAETAFDAAEVAEAAAPNKGEATGTVAETHPSFAITRRDYPDDAPDPMILTDDMVSEEDEGVDSIDFRHAAWDEGAGFDADEYEDLLLALAETAEDQEVDWFAAADGPQDFDDFDPQEDDLVVVWDDATHAEPEVEVRRSADDPALAHVLLGDVIVARFRTKANVDHDQVSLMPLSVARELGWAHA